MPRVMCMGCGASVPPRTRCIDGVHTPWGSEYDRAWAKVSRQHRAAHPRCVMCGSTDDTTTDHKTPLMEGGTNAPSNLQTLCRSCHAKKTLNDHRRWRAT